MDRFRPLLIATLGLMLSLTATPAALAQEATPPVGEVIDPAECQIGPRTIEGIDDLIGPAVSDEVAATPSLEEIGPLTGEAADQETIEAVTATYRELVACLNAGEYLRVYALYTDDYVRRNLAERGEDLEQLLATPVPRGEQQTALVSVRDVRLVEGDHVAARVETYDPTVGGTIIIDAILVLAGERYLIDAETVVDAPTEGDAAATDNVAGAVEAIAVESYDIYFEPTAFTIPADTDVTVTLPNEGVTLHNFAIDELGIDVDIAPGTTEETVINAPAGTYEYYCNVPGHKAAGMLGTMTVE